MAPKEPVSREALFDLVWSEPMTNVAAHFGVSSSYLARVCQRMGVPRPPRGYWAKMSAGHSVTKPDLPAARPRDELVWAAGVDRWTAPTISPAAPAPVSSSTKYKMRKRPATHRLIRGARELFLKGHVNDIGYLKPSKRLLVDLIVSESALDQALAIANELFLTFEDFGCYVDLSPPSGFVRDSFDERESPDRKERYMTQHWSPCRPTIVNWGSVAIGLTLFETTRSVEMVYRNGKYIPLTEEREKPGQGNWHSWTTMKDMPTGKLMLKAYSPYFRAEWHQVWQLPISTDKSKAFRKLVRDVIRAAQAIPPLVQAAERIAQKEREERLAWERHRQQQEHETMCRKALEASKDGLARVISAWSEAKQIDAFFNEIEGAIATADPQQQMLVKERLDRARKLLPTPDALQALIDWQTPHERYPDFDSTP